MRILIALVSLFSTQAFAQTTTWSIDPMHASIVFKINHLGFSNVHGLFPNLEGTITLDDKAVEKSSFDLKLPVDKVFTGAPKRDDHLRSPDFFNVKQFPNITLKSKTVKKNGADKYDVVADLTMHGVTKPVSFTFHRLKTDKDPWGNTRTGGETTLKLKRSEYGMNFMNKPGEVGDDVELTISLEAVKK